MQANNTVFSIQNLNYTYNRGDRKKANHVIHDLSVDFPEGKVTTIIGANGCGKSTLLNLMMKAYTPDSGSISLQGTDIAALKLKEYARRVAIVHQYNTAPEDLTVEKLVSFGRTPYKKMGFSASIQEDEEKIAWALEITEMTELKERQVSELSGGQKQRAWIAMALAQGTDILFLDEPTTYLDIRYQLQILQLARKLNREFGLTIIMVLHDINQSLYYSDHIIAMKDGRLVAQGAPEDVISADLMKQVYDVDLPVSSHDGKPFILPV